MADTSKNNNEANTAPPAGEEEVILGPDGQPLSKNQIKKLKAKKAKEEKKRLAAERRAAEEARRKELAEKEKEFFGMLPVNRSTERPGRKYTEVWEVTPELAEQTVLVRARVHVTRGAGNLAFVLLRSRMYSIQGVVAKGGHVSKNFVKFVGSLHREALVNVEAVVKVPDSPIDSASQSGVELNIQKLHVVSDCVPDLPLLVEDASRPLPVIEERDAEREALSKQLEAAEKVAAEAAEGDAKTEAEKKVEEIKKELSHKPQYPRVGQSNRLDNRVLDLRRPAGQAIFRIQAAVCKLFRDFLIKNNFTEIHTPKTLGIASEGGANVFSFDWFGKPAFLAQSPQLYKQMAVCSGFDRVFEIGPVFRAEKHFTYRHLCEFTGLDFEMAIKEHYHEVLDFMNELLTSIFDGLFTEYAHEISVVSQQFPVEKFTYTKEPVRLEWPQAIEMLRKDGVEIGDFDDLSTEQERRLGELVRAEHNTDFFFLDKFPLSIRPFYTMPDAKDERYSNSYDLFIRGNEICSGAQRIHDKALLEERMKAHGVTPDDVKDYHACMTYGAPPHGGGGFGLERIVMLFLGLKNVRHASFFPRDPQRVNP